MKKTVIMLVAVFVFASLYAADVPAPVSPAAEAAAEAVTKTSKDEKSMVDSFLGIFAPSEKKADSVTQTAQAMEAEYIETPEEEGFTLPGKLLIAADLFSAGIAAVSWINLAQGTDYYKTAYEDINNTTLENYDLLKRMREDVLNAEAKAWIATGVAAAFIGYTVADALWLHAAFPLEPEYKTDGETQVLTLNYRF